MIMTMLERRGLIMLKQGCLDQWELEQLRSMSHGQVSSTGVLRVGLVDSLKQYDGKKRDLSLFWLTMGLLIILASKCNCMYYAFLTDQVIDQTLRNETGSAQLMYNYTQPNGGSLLYMLLPFYYATIKNRCFGRTVICSKRIQYRYNVIWMKKACYTTS